MVKPYKHSPSKCQDLLGAIIDREPFAYREQEPVKGSGELPKAPARFHEEVAWRSEILRVERAKIQKPSAKLIRTEFAHLHTFAFSAEEIRKSLRISKKHGGRS